MTMKHLIIRLFKIDISDFPDSLDYQIRQIVNQEVSSYTSTLVREAVQRRLDQRFEEKVEEPVVSKKPSVNEEDIDTNLKAAQKSIEDKMENFLDEVINKEREISDQDFLIRNPKILEHP